MEDITLSERRAIGAKIRKEVLGANHTQNNANPHLFDTVFLEYTEDVCWGNVWNRDGLTRATRSMLNLGMLTAMSQHHELSVHVKGALRNGVTKEEIRAVLMQAAVYCGAPLALADFRVASEAIKAYEAETASA